MLYSFYILTLALCALVQATWFKQTRDSFFFKLKLPGLHAQRSAIVVSSTTPQYTFSLPPKTVVLPSTTSQGMVVTSILPSYEVCDTPDHNTTSCSTVFETTATSSCSTVLTYAFRKVTVTECDQNITFSTSNSYAIATATATATPKTVAFQKFVNSSTHAAPSMTTYIQSITSLWHAPWQSLAAGTPTDITLEVCRQEYDGKQNCSEAQQAWIVHTEEVPITSTKALSISTSFSSVLLSTP